MRTNRGTPEQRARRCLRNHANRKLSSLLREFGFECVWCSREIIALRDVDGPILQVRKKAVKWLQEGTIIDCLLATTDHLVPISEGGRSNRENLVPACVSCNNNRMKREQRAHFETRRLELIATRVKSHEVAPVFVSIS